MFIFNVHQMFSYFTFIKLNARFELSLIQNTFSLTTQGLLVSTNVLEYTTQTTDARLLYFYKIITSIINKS